MNVQIQGKLLGRVLLVEDDEITGENLSRRLARFGLQCVWKKSYEEAISAFQSELFHAVVTDIYLNGQKDRGGLEIVREVGKSGTPVVMITSAADLEIAREGLNNGAVYLLEKPFDAEQLRKILETIWESPKGLCSLLERFLDIHGLTTKEKEITRLLIKGLSNKEISELTGNTEKTIKFHFTAIYAKCGVEKRSELFNAIFPT